MEHTDMMQAIEAMLFAAGEPVTFNDAKKVFLRLWQEEALDETAIEARQTELRAAFDALREQAQKGDASRGFGLVLVADGLTFRSDPRHAAVLRAMREEKPMRLSQAALETLAIVAYRQPVTKPDADEIRGVDCGATLRLLLDRNLIRIVGKKEEPGRPMLYGTTREFLSFFNLGNLAQLPTLREFQELNQDAVEELDEFDAAQPTLKDLSTQAKRLTQDDPGLAALDEAVTQLSTTEGTARAALAAQGIALEEGAAPADESTTSADPKDRSESADSAAG